MNYHWWQTGIIYQVYPRSFQDSNQDGIGDLRGIIRRLDHLKWLGVKAVWISPVYPSPMADFGYDISDYRNIDPVFGTLEDFDELVREIHDRDMKLIMDFVPNHTSSMHPWFIESRSSRDNPKRDWYMWNDPLPNGDPPNNWLSVFGGSAWEWDEKTGQFYFHSFLKEQPDLNWRNPDVRNAMYSILRFWLDKGIDGFRIDVIWHLIKDKQLRDNPKNPYYEEHMSDYDQLLPVYSTDQPEVHEIVEEIRNVLDHYEERLMIGEIYLPIHKLVTYYGPGGKGAQLPFNFMLISLPWDPRKIATAIDEYESALPENAWPNWVIGNHDQPRITSRVGIHQARIAAMLLLTLRGTPTMYYGDEIEMRDVPIPWDEIVDPQGKNMPGKNLSRDPSRTPMQWDNSLNAGFSEAKPWLRIDRRYHRINVESEKNNQYSTLLFYRKLIELRQKEPCLMYGNYIPLHSDNQMIVYYRQTGDEPCFLIALNLSHRPCYFTTSKISLKGEVILATSPEMEGVHIDNEIDLSGDEGVIIKLEKQ
ncbi:MAG TPA: alpha-amylase family glycosyl hydrolase [Bacteroidales bacterium]|nr:alpha-amylase family glycosyl hydrolase [Bacteroidales bacterium]